MAKQARTPEQKAEDKQRENLLALCNGLKSAFSLKKLPTWADVYRRIGYSDAYIEQTYHKSERDKPVTFVDLKDYCEDLRLSLEAQIWLKHNPPDTKDLRTSDVVLEAVKEIVDDESGFHNTQDYGLVQSSNEKAFLFWFQKKAVKELLDGMCGFDTAICPHVTDLAKEFLARNQLKNIFGKRSQLLLASTGTGKTFMAGALLRRLYDINFHENRTWCAIPYLYVTRATIVEQTKRVFQTFFGFNCVTDVEVINIEQLRSKYGKIWLKEETIVEYGVERTVWRWRNNLSPCVVLWDESQGLKNDTSTQHAIGAAYNDIPVNTWQVHISATPFTRVSEAKCFAVGTHKNISDGVGLGGTVQLSNLNWPTYAAAVASPSKPDEYNEAAVERLTDDLNSFIVRVKGVRPQFEAKNNIEMISFKTAEERTYYLQAWERYLEQKRKLEGEDAPADSKFLILVQLLKFSMAAELCRAEILVDRMMYAVAEGYAAVAAVKFKGTIIKMNKILASRGVPRSQISLIWGGGQTALTKKQKLLKKVKENAAKMAEAGLTLEDLDLDDVEDRELENLPPELRLGPQSPEERQREIDKFQSGKTLYCMYTFRAGGVGLSLHHSDELTKEKVKRQKNGYAVAADIANIPVRPRRNFVAPTYSAIELVQGLGRCPRLTSLSDTPQTLLFYRGTIEDDIAAIVSAKLRCLSRVVRMRESWQDCIVGNNKHIVQSHLTVNGESIDEDSDWQGGGDVEDDE